MERMEEKMDFPFDFVSEMDGDAVGDELWELVQDRKAVILL